MTDKTNQDNRYWLTDIGYHAIDDAPVTPQLVAVPLIRYPVYVDKPRAGSPA